VIYVTIYVLCSYYIAKHFCCYFGGIRVQFGGMGRFKERVNSVIIDVIITEMYYI